MGKWFDSLSSDHKTVVIDSYKKALEQLYNEKSCEDICPAAGLCIHFPIERVHGSFVCSMCREFPLLYAEYREVMTSKGLFLWRCCPCFVYGREETIKRLEQTL
jgi:hypothetical protein